MCIHSVHDITYAVIDMEESMTRAMEVADRLENYLNSGDLISNARVLRELNNVDTELKSARSRNAFIRKALNRRETK